MACGSVVTPVVFVGNVAFVDDQIGICGDVHGGERGGSTGVHYYTSLRVERRRPFFYERITQCVAWHERRRVIRRTVKM